MPQFDVSTITEDPTKYHNMTVHVQGIVTSVCKEEGCFIDIVALSGAGAGVLINARNGAFKFPIESVGKIAVVKGTFYSKVYPFSRMDHWHHHGWRVWEKEIPSFARILRIEADSVSFEEAKNQVTINESPLIPFTSPIINLDQMEFEAASMRIGKKCLNPEESIPEHSTQCYHELLIAIEGEMFVRMENFSEDIKLSPGLVCYVPPNTKHFVTNRSARKACYIFVCSLPEQVEDNQ
ncbi:MAG: cupin domain-containing protein [Spirochaetota bacterium]|nr:cupin domain-containing protein [Spirochaetota bacterium]